MDELLCPDSTACSSPSPASVFSTAGPPHQEPGFMSSEVLERWLGMDECLLDDEHLLEDGAAWGDEGSRAPDNEQELPGRPPAPPAPKRRGRKPGPRSSGTPITHVEAERQRRDKLNRRFCELRAAVPTVSRMDKASLLADAAAYIAQLRGRVEQLEAEARAGQQAAATAAVAPPAHASSAQERLEVRMVGMEAAALRLTAAAAGHAPARLMLALRSLDLPVQHACVCRVGGVTVQDAVVDVPAALRDERGLRAALLSRLQQQSGY
ncbi:transcription factor MYC2-like [Panicum miliaceum]|uniref:Transcription factor n=1 Tax=Panicum miliaceum TaxID=4540 RepID=A0A3L6RK90_PANMI|nr:transcription factor MYC2-like [Panicum miliaceum]